MNISCLSLLVMFFFSLPNAWHMVRTPIMKIGKNIMNLQQGHIIMQRPSQAHLHRWDELVSPDHKSTHGRFEPVTDVIQQDGWISGSKVTITNLPDRKKKLLLCYFWLVDCLIACSAQAIDISIKQSHSCPKRTLQFERCTWRLWHVQFSPPFHSCESFTSLDLRFNSSISNHIFEQMIEISVYSSKS